MKCPFLIGSRIYLRALTLKDLSGHYLNWLNDPEVCQYNSHHVYPYSQEAGKKYIQAASRSNTALVLAIVDQASDTHIGNIALQEMDSLARSAEFAILLGEKSYWGRGLSKEAALLLMTHGFVSLNLNRIHCGTSAHNKAMQKLALFLGMKPEGRRRQALFKNGQFVDLLEYGVLKSEFQKRIQE